LGATHGTEAEAHTSVTLHSYGCWAAERDRSAQRGGRCRRCELRTQTTVFADVRLKRSERPKGFSGDAFKRVVGESRYSWMRGLGREKICDKRLWVKMLCPETAVDCSMSCRMPRVTTSRALVLRLRVSARRQETTCHKDTVGDLLLSKRRSGKKVYRS
jgi:hypothetical protein